MSALSNAELPAFTTLEQICAYCGLAASRVNPSLAHLESSDTSTQVAQAVIINDSEGLPRLIVRMSIPLSSDYATSSQDLWLDSEELSNTAVPAAFKV